MGISRIYKKPSIILLFCLIILHSDYSGQNNSLFSSNNSKWSQKIGYWMPIIGGGINYHYYYSSWILQGDTSVNNLTYQKVYYAGNFANKIDTLCYTFSKFIVNDSNKIYAGIRPDTMVLEYDFNLVKGDSFLIRGGIGSNGVGGIPGPQNYYPKVDSINTIFYAGKWRKHIRFSLLPYNTRISWIEGVGDASYGLLANYMSIMIYNSYGTAMNGFSCFYDGQTMLSSGNCQYQNCVTTNYSDFKENIVDIEVFPNPTLSQFVVKTSVDFDNIVLRDAIGNLMDFNSFKIDYGYKISLNSRFEGGVYFLYLIKGNYSIVKKILINE